LSGAVGLTLDLPDALIESVAERVLEHLRAEPQRRFLSKEGLAVHLCVSERRVKSLREQGLPAHKVGRILLFDLEEVNQWLSRQPT
jgi:hypothetical protein